MSDSNPEARDRVSDMLAKWCGEQAPTDADYMCEAGSPGHKPGIPAATPDPPPDDLCAVVFRALHSSRNTQMSDEMRAAYIASVITAEAAPAASPDERLREAGERLAQTVAQVCGEGHPALGMWRVALAAADREAPDGETPAASPDERLREALAFYADESTWKRGQTTGPFSHGDPMPAHVDLGERARAALAGVSAPAVTSADERLREALERANDDLILIADESPEGVGESIDSVRAAIKDALAAADREKPEE